VGLFFSPEAEQARDREATPEGTTLWQLLQVEENYIPAVCRVAALRIPLWWLESGRPAGQTALSVFLHQAINRCAQEGIRYPKVVLLRLKQMQRGEWSPANLDRPAVNRRGGFQSVGEFLRGEGGREPRTIEETMD